MSNNAKYYWLLIAFLGWISHPVLAQEIKPKDTYAKVQHLNEGLVTLLRQNLQVDFSLQVNESLMNNSIQPRHVYQLALDVELKLLDVLRSNGIQGEQVAKIATRLYEPSDVYGLLNRMHQRVAHLMDYYRVAQPHEYVDDHERVPADVFFALERMERFLLKMGAPATQPGHTLRRARAIAFLSERICSHAICNNVRRQAKPDYQVVVPVHVYQETYLFINALWNYVQSKGLEIPGGVLALKPQEGMVNPAQVNKLMGIALADTAFVAKFSTSLDTVELPGFNPNALPADVWREINYARRLLEAMVD